MKNFALPPHSLGEIGTVATRVGNLLGVECEQTIYPNLRNTGCFAMGSVSRDLVKIGSKLGISIPESNQLSQLGVNLQTILSELISRGVISDNFLK